MLYCHVPVVVPARGPRCFYGKLFTHLTADTEEELLAYLPYIKFKREWLQKAGTPYFHVDVTGVRLKMVLEDSRVKVLSRRQYVLRSKRKM